MTADERFGERLAAGLVEDAQLLGADRLAQDPHRERVHVGDLELCGRRGVHEPHEVHPDRRERPQEGGEQDLVAIGDALAGEDAGSMQGDDGLAGAWPAAYSGGAVVVRAGDAALRRMEVDHPLFDRAVEEAPELRAGLDGDDFAAAVLGEQAASQLGLLERESADARHFAAGECVEVVLRALPEIGEQENEVGIGGSFGESDGDVDAGRHLAQERIELVVDALVAAQHGVVEGAEAVLNVRGCALLDSSGLATRFAGGSGDGWCLWLDDRDAACPAGETDLG